MLIKYMGAADKRVFRKGEDFGGRMSTPLPRDVVLDWQNRHVIDSEHEDHKDLPKTFWDLLVVEPGFQNVTGMDTVPLNDAQRLWLGQRDEHDTRWARQANEVLTGSRVSGAPELVQYNEKYPTILSPPPDLYRPAGVTPNDDIEPGDDNGPNGNGGAGEPFTAPVDEANTSDDGKGDSKDKVKKP